MVEKIFLVNRDEFQELQSKIDVDGIRVNLNTKALEYFDGTIWRVAGGGLRVGNVIKFSAKPGDRQVKLNWQDPSDIVINDSSGKPTTVARWSGTQIRRKTGSYPVDYNDGELVVDSEIRNQYASNEFIDSGLLNEVEYFYMAFPYTDNGIFTVDSANRDSATPSANDDKYGTPGNVMLLAGDMQAGYFGTVPASEFIDGNTLASILGISVGTSQYPNTDWLKFGYKEKILFSPMKPIRHSISWNNIGSANALFGNKTIEIKGFTYKVRLWRGTEHDPANSYSNDADRDAIGSEWNNLMLPIHEHAATGNWYNPAYAGNVEDWGIGLTDADLITASSYGNGFRSWCIETSDSYELDAIVRGRNGVSDILSLRKSTGLPNDGWRPVLELVE